MAVSRPASGTSRASRVRRAAAATDVFTGIGFGVPALVGIVHLRRTGEVWTFLGFPTYGDGPFTDIGIETTVPLLAGFIGVCTAEVALGWLIARGSTRAPTLSWMLLPIELAYWMGFALPFGPILGLTRAALLVADRRRDRRFVERSSGWFRSDEPGGHGLHRSTQGPLLRRRLRRHRLRHWP